MRLLAYAAALSALCICIACSSVSAAQTRKLINQFGAFSSPQGVGIQQSTGDVYVADAENARVEKFDALGNLLLGFGADVGGSGVDTCTTICGPGTPGSTPGSFTTAKFLAVDNSTSVSAGDVYVADTGDQLVSKFDATGKLISSWGTGGQLSGSTTTAGSFGELAGIAVDSSGTLYVFNAAKQLFRFSQAGAFEAQIEEAGERGAVALGFALDGEGHLFRANGDESIEKLNANGSDIGTVTPDASFTVPHTSAFTVDQEDGALYATAVERVLDHYEFNGADEVIEPGGGSCAPVANVGCEPTDSFALPFIGSGIDVADSSGDAYIANPETGEVFVYAPVTVPDVTTEAPTGVGPTSATLNATVNPDAIALSECFFQYGTTTSYGKVATCVPSAATIPGDSSPHAVSAEATGLEAGASYDYRLVAGNANGSNQGANQTLSTPPRPSIDSATVTELSASQAKLTVKINPNGFDTHYHLEYGTSTSYTASVPIPTAEIGAGGTDVTVSQTITGLSQNTTYHWRVIAENINGITTSVDHSFVYETAGPELPDNRAYEMVTPPQKNGTLIGSVLFGVPDVAGSGNRVIAESIQCFAEAQSCNGQRGDGIGTPYEFQRTSSGWQTTAIAPPSAPQTPIYTPWAENAEAGTVLFSAPTEPFGEDDFYGRNGDGTLTHIGPNTPPEDGADGPLGGNPSGDEQAVSVDLSHVAWNAKTGHWPFDETTGEYATYEYSGTNNTQPMLVGVSGGEGSHDLISECGTALGGFSTGAPPGAMSADGRTVFFTALNCAMGNVVPADALYARIDGELPDAHTVQISARSPSKCNGACASSPAGDALFKGASVDGSMVLFASTQQLTNDASEDNHAGDTAADGECGRTTGANGCNLYLYDFASPAGQQLVDVSAGDASGEGPRVQGVVAISEDGSHSYFVAKGVLTSAPNVQGQSAQNGANNLYLYERDAAHPSGITAFVASLPETDSGEWEISVGRPANVTPDGRYLVFVSHGNLTRDDTSQSGAEQVFRYDAKTGELIRISIGNNGFNDNGNRSASTPCGLIGCSEDASVVFKAVSRRDPTMSDDGSYIFFQSPVALAPQALDDVRIATDNSGNPVYAENVYEWHEGHVYLISDGRDVSVDAGQDPHCPDVAAGVPSSVCLLGTDTTGSNVFFSTTDPLTTQDTDTELDYYDARICRESDPCFQPPSAPVQCQADACQGTPPPIPPGVLAASVSFVGPGNAKSAVGATSTTSVGKLSLLSHTVHGTSFSLMVKVPGKGKVTITGPGIAKVQRSLSGPGSFSVAVKLTNKGRESLKRKHKLKLTLKIAYTPSSGAPSTAKATLTLKL